MTRTPINLADAILPCLQHKKAKVISLIGGGGKTSLMYYLVEEFSQQGIRALAATTTKLFFPDKGETAFLASVPEGRHYLKTACFATSPVTVARDFFQKDRRKITGLQPEWIDCLACDFPDYVWIVEADGAAGKPLKGHLDYEPVIPAATSLVLAVVGIDALGQPLDGRYVHRPEQIQAISGYYDEPQVTDAMIAVLLASPNGYRRHFPPAAHFLPVLNKVETALQMKQAERLARTIRKTQPDMNRIIAGSVRKRQFYSIS